MTPASLTSTESFAARLLRSERWRILLMAAALLIVLLGVIVRRALGGAVMTSNAVFYPTLAVLIFALAYQGLALRTTQLKARLGGAIQDWQRILSIAIDLATTGALLLILQLHSPRGAEAALGGPSLLLLPLVILLSILRLRPSLALGTGLGAAAVHLALVIHAFKIADIETDHHPILFSYAVLLAVIGAAAAVVAWMARLYVIEAVAEATAAERAQHAMAVIEQDLRLARDIQMGLMPSESPSIAGYDVVGMARPAALAGGDYYDWQPLPDGRLVVAVADVTGHGIGPALVMAVCRAYARASAPTSSGPEALLAHLNALIYQDVKGERFITMALAIVSGDGRIDLISAGHGPTLLYRAAGGSVESFGGDGLPLGVVDVETYGPHRSVRLESGDVLVMLTDGFVEHGRDGDLQLFGEARLTAALQASASQPASLIITAIDAAVHAFAAGAVQLDDMTAVVIKRK